MSPAIRFFIEDPLISHLGVGRTWVEVKTLEIANRNLEATAAGFDMPFGKRDFPLIP